MYAMTGTKTMQTPAPENVEAASANYAAQTAAAEVAAAAPAAEQTAEKFAEPKSESAPVQAEQPESKTAKPRKALPLTPTYDPETRINGFVKFFNYGKGFGFIISGENAENSYFVHHTQIVSDDEYKYLEDNQPVEFTPAVGPKGSFAKKVVALD
jgi:cold shock protein